MSPDALQKVMIKLGKQKLPLASDPANDSIYSFANGSAPQRRNPEIPKPLRAYVPDRLEDVDWKSMGPGIKYFAITGLNVADGTLSLL